MMGCAVCDVEEKQTCVIAVGFASLASSSTGIFDADSKRSGVILAVI